MATHCSACAYYLIRTEYGAGGGKGFPFNFYRTTDLKPEDSDLIFLALYIRVALSCLLTLLRLWLQGKHTLLIIQLLRCTRSYTLFASRLNSCFSIHFIYCHELLGSRLLYPLRMPMQTKSHFKPANMIGKWTLLQGVAFCWPAGEDPTVGCVFHTPISPQQAASKDAVTRGLANLLILYCLSFVRKTKAPKEAQNLHSVHREEKKNNPVFHPSYRLLCKGSLRINKASKAGYPDQSPL